MTPSSDTNSTAEKTETWFRLEPREIPWLMPIDRGDLVAVIALAALFLLTSFFRLNHTDLWGHLNFGRWMVENRQIPAGDPLRDRKESIAENHIHTPSWLAQVLGFLWYGLAGADGMVLAHSAIRCLTAVVVMAAIRAGGGSKGWATIGAVVGFLIELPIVGTIRPQLFGELCFAITLLAVVRLATGRGPLYWLPIVSCAWANLHGSAPLGLVVVGSYCVGHLLSAWNSSRSVSAAVQDPLTLWYALAGLLSLIAMCVNPIGWDVLIDAVVFAKNPILASITEWRPLTLTSLSGSLFYGSFIATVFLARFSRQKFDPQTVILLIGLGIAALGAIRMLAWWALAWPVLIAPHAASVWDRVRASRPAEQFANDPDAERPTTMRTLIAIAAVFMVLVWSPATHGFIVGRNRPEALAMDPATPLLVAEEMANRGLKGRFFAPLDWADYIVWKTNGAMQPLVHSHIHLMSTGVWEDYQRLAAAAAPWLEIADFEGLQYLVVRHDGQEALASAALKNPRCRLIYRDQKTSLIQIMADVEADGVKKKESTEEKSAPPVEEKTSTDRVKNLEHEQESSRTKTE